MGLLISAYGGVCYLVFLGTFLYAIGFLGGIVVPKGINDGEPTGAMAAIVINTALIVLFGLQHTIMARGKFKAALTRVIPPAAERSTFVLMASLALILMFWQWRPMPEVIWSLDGAGEYAVIAVHHVGWVIVLLSTFMIDHFHLFGLRQVYNRLVQRQDAPSRFMVRGFYKLVRHPLMLGLIIAFWATPHMTHGHLLFAAVNTLYILVGLVFEERDLVRELGDDYRAYQQRVPRLLPISRRRTPAPRPD